MVAPVLLKEKSHSFSPFCPLLLDTLQAPSDTRDKNMVTRTPVLAPLPLLASLLFQLSMMLLSGLLFMYFYRCCSPLDSLLDEGLCCCCLPWVFHLAYISYEIILIILGISGMIVTTFFLVKYNKSKIRANTLSTLCSKQCLVSPPSNRHPTDNHDQPCVAWTILCITSMFYQFYPSLSHKFFFNHILNGFFV